MALKKRNDMPDKTKFKIKIQQVFIVILTISLLLTNFALAQDLNWDNNYLLDQAGIFENNPADQEALVKDLQEVNQNEQLALRILTVKSIGEKNFKNYCQSLYQDSFEQKNNQIVLVYNQENNQLKQCNWVTPATTITDDEFNYIINGLVQPNIDSNQLVFALRMAAKEIARADIENVVPKNYQAKIETEKNQRNKQIIIWVFIAILFSWLAAVLGRTKGWWLGGIIGFLLGLFIWWISRIWFFMPLFLITGLIYDYFVSRKHKEYKTCQRGAFWCTAEELEKRKKEEEE